ncbi:hypothetical protein HOY82DRAFT_536637 [Tuber indicum]|nr:hypothetical protein HOY82DRAFT_536637 [Tuber indicum]
MWMLPPTILPSGVSRPQAEKEQFTQPDKHATELRSDVDELKANGVIVNLHLENPRSSVDQIKTDLKDLTNKLDRKTNDLANKLDRKADKTDAKIDRAVYFFIAELFLKGGFDVYIMKQDKTERQETGQVE